MLRHASELQNDHLEKSPWFETVEIDEEQTYEKGKAVYRVLAGAGVGCLHWAETQRQSGGRKGGSCVSPMGAGGLGRLEGGLPRG